MLILAKTIVRILNHTITITSDEDQEYMDKVASKIERKVKRLSDELHTRNMTEVALFVAMDYCDQFTKAMDDNANLRGQIKDYLQESAFSRKQYEDTKKENEQLKNEINALRARLSSENTSARTVKSERTEKIEKPVKTDVSATIRKTESAPTVQVKLPVLEKKSVEMPAESKAPIQGTFDEDVFGETADATAEIMSFFEQKAFMDDDE